MVSRKAQLIKVGLLDVLTVVVLGDGWSLEATHGGQSTISPNVKLSNVLYVLSLKENIILASMALEVSGTKVIIENGLC